MNTSLIITAAGTGSRFDQKVPKLLVKINEKPVIWHSIHAFSMFQFSQIIITTHPDTHDQIKEVSDSFDMDIRCIPGAQTRTESVKNAVLSLDTCDRILIHDAARPCVSPALIQRLLNHQANTCIPVIPSTDTLKTVRDNQVVGHIDRASCFKVQTPQSLEYQSLINAYQSIPNIDSFTDESSLIQSLEIPVHTVMGDPKNIKLTTTTDLELLRVFLSAMIT